MPVSGAAGPRAVTGPDAHTHRCSCRAVGYGVKRCRSAVATPKRCRQWSDIRPKRLLLFVSVCVCVCPTLDKGFSTTTLFILHEQGGKASGDEPCPTKLSRWRGSTKGRFGVYLPLNLCTSCSTLGLFHGGFTILPPNPLFPSSCAAVFAAFHRSRLRVSADDNFQC